MRSFLVNCRYESGDEAPETACQALQKPDVTVTCPACDFCTDTAQHRNCSGRGTCDNGACMCESGWSGATCDVQQAVCASTVLDVDGNCCPSGMLDTLGACCPGSNAVIDKAGQCCSSGEIDGCGVCGGDGLFHDIMGVCCKVSPLLLASPFQLFTHRCHHTLTLNHLE